MEWNESGFRPLLCTYRLNWARRTSCGWWVEWDDTSLQTQDSKFKPWRSEVEHATSRSRKLPTTLSFTSGWGRNICVSFKLPSDVRRTTNSSVKGSGANHHPRVPAHMHNRTYRPTRQNEFLTEVTNITEHKTKWWPVMFFVQSVQVWQSQNQVKESTLFSGGWEEWKKSHGWKYIHKLSG